MLVNNLSGGSSILLRIWFVEKARETEASRLAKRGGFASLFLSGGTLTVG